MASLFCCGKKGFVCPRAKFVTRGAKKSQTRRTTKARCVIWYKSIEAQTKAHRMANNVSIKNVPDFSFCALS
jgi:hypothetical protein